MNEAQRVELINAAYAVVRYPSVHAYRSGGYDKKVGRPAMARLLKALEAVVDPDSKAVVEIATRLAAVEAHDRAFAAWQESVGRS
jgi:hypothetical protein